MNAEMSRFPYTKVSNSRERITEGTRIGAKSVPAFVIWHFSNAIWTYNQTPFSYRN
jgi:hypothetical protein